MPITITGDRAANVVEIDPGVLARGAGTIVLKGEGGRISMGAGGSVFGRLTITVGAGCTVAIGQGCYLGHLTVFTANGATIRLGDGVGVNGAVRLIAHEAAGITVGDRCLIAGNVEVISSDMHSILDARTGRRINGCRDVVIGEHVWIGAGASVMKGARIGAETVIGAHSVVTGDVPGGCIAVGVPARVVRRGVTWSRSLLPVEDASPAITATRRRWGLGWGRR